LEKNKINLDENLPNDENNWNILTVFYILLVFLDVVPSSSLIDEVLPAAQRLRIFDPSERTEHKMLFLLSCYRRRRAKYPAKLYQNNLKILQKNTNPKPKNPKPKNLTPIPYTLYPNLFLD
jgi:hypothetical protein